MWTRLFSRDPPQAGLLKRYLAREEGNIVLLTAIILPILVLAFGAAFDYTGAGRRKETLNGISDAAALSATQPGMMGESCASSTSATCQVVVAQVVSVFNTQAAQIQGVSGATIAASNVTIVDVPDASNVIQRTATVNWNANSNNLFGGILGFANIAISGTSVAKNGAAPVTTIFMLIDNSPSMAFPAQSSGVATMIEDTPGNNIAGGNGCALGCHQYDQDNNYDDGVFNPSNVICASGANALSNGVFTDGGLAFPCVMNIGGVDTVNPAGTGVTTYTSGSKHYTCATQTSNTKSPSANQYIGNCTTGATSSSACMQGGQSVSKFKYFGAEDAFALSRCLAVQLRIDLVNQAVASLMSTAPSVAQTNKTTYAVQIYTLDYGNNNKPDSYTSMTATAPTKVVVGLYDIYNWGCSASIPACTTGYTPTEIQNQTWSTMSSMFSTAGSAAGGLAPLETYHAGTVTGGGVSLSSGVSGYSSQNTGSDDDSYIDQDGLKGMYSLMPSPGSGVSGSTPAELLFIVSDGENDTNGSKPSHSCTGSTGLYTYFSRPEFCVNQLTNSSTGNSYCTDIKNKGIRIAFLYLRYNALNPYSDYFSDFEPWQYPGNSSNTTDNFTGQTDEIEQAAISCATTGLEYTVDTGDNITSAMSALFQKAVQAAYLAK